jgi:hypothetical protein
MERTEVMSDHDNDTKDELISPLHLDNRKGPNRLMKSTSLDYKFLFDYVHRELIAEAADNITPDNEDGSEEEADEPDLGEQS